MKASLVCLALAGLIGCGTGPTEEGGPDKQLPQTKQDPRPISKQDIQGCWHEVENPVTSYYCVDLCFSLSSDRFEQVVTTPDEISYKKRYNLFGLKWTETERTRSLQAFGHYSLKSDTLFRDFSYPDPPSPDTAEIWSPKTPIRFSGDTLVAAGHLYLRPNESRQCTDFWKTFDPDPDPISGGGGGGDWD